MYTTAKANDPLDGREIHTARIGIDGEPALSGTPAALFPWWSFTKTVIAVCALRLSEDGRLDLRAPLPGRPFTTLDLLRNASGLPDYGTLPAYHEAVRRGDSPWPRDLLLERVDAGRLLFAPGEGWSYSNVGYMLAREMVESAAGYDLGVAVEALVAGPLGLASVRLARSAADFDAVHWSAAHGYDPGWVYHGCLVGTAADAARLLHALATGELLSAETLAVMMERRPLGGPLPGRPWSATGYGAGLMSGAMEGVGRVFGHSGGGPSCVNAVYHFPDLDMPVTVAAFTDGTDEGIAEFAAARLAANARV